MARANSQKPRHIVMQSMPALNIGPSKMTTCALGPRIYVGNLTIWNTFANDARACFNTTPWRQHIIQYASGRTPTKCSVLREHVQHGSEIDVHARTNQHLGQYMTAVAQSQGIDCKVAGYHCTTDRLVGHQIPGMVLMTVAGNTVA
ncbi:uncharacterized protein BDV14DRAFT_172087 [Aspergillus stella-maris]|uniref:uncharacterized protein n=1 Tax=Aspergillus stella-maris TaxID=1810926 RepID=UPI003CCD3DAE